MSGLWGGTPPGSSVPGSAGATSTASVSGLRHSRPYARGADQESGAHIPMRIGGLAVTTGMNGKS